MLPMLIARRAGAGEGGVGMQVREGLGGPLHVPSAGDPPPRLSSVGCYSTIGHDVCI